MNMIIFYFVMVAICIAVMLLWKKSKKTIQTISSSLSLPVALEHPNNEFPQGPVAYDCDFACNIGKNKSTMVNGFGPANFLDDAHIEMKNGERE